MQRKIAAVWVSLLIIVSSIILVDIAERIEAPYISHAPFRINNNAEFASMAGSEGWAGDGSLGNPYIIEGYDINGSGYGYCIYIGNTTVYFEVKDSYLHEATGIISVPYFTETGITLYKVQNGTITNNNASFNRYYGIFLYSSSGNTISNNNATSNNTVGIYLSSSSNNMISNNNVSNNFHGIDLRSSSDSNSITNNTASNNFQSIFLDSSSGNTISYNNASNNYYSISIRSSSENNIIANNNAVNNEYGIILDSSNNNTITNNNASSNNVEGISLFSSSNNIFHNNTASNNDLGMYLRSSYTNTITNNNFSQNNEDGIYLYSSTSNTFTNNTASNNSNGFFLYYSDNNSISYNIISNNIVAIYLYFCKSNTIFNNEMVKDGIYIVGDIVDYWNTHIIDTTNSVNGKPVYYLKNQNSGSVPQGAGQVILANSNNVIIENQNTSDGTGGIILGFSSGNTIVNNTSSKNFNCMLLYFSNNNTIINTTALNNDYGIYLYYSNDNKITNNNASSHIDYGIALVFSSNSNTIINNTISNNDDGIIISLSNDNKIFHNNLIGNANQSDDGGENNRWDNGYPLGGNYWSDYSGVDNFKGPNQDIPGSDVLGDTPYIIDADSKDNYPLMKPFTNRTFDNYTILKQGWNLISTQLIQEVQNLTTVLQMIEGYYDAVQWYNISETNEPWKHHKVGKAFGNDLNELNETMSSWIHITQPGETIFLYNGTQPTFNQTIQLHPGWNMVGYPSLSSHNRTTGLNNLTFDIQVDAIQWFDAATKTWYFMGPDDSFVPGRGYWVHSKIVAEWEVPL
jgi:parallel beta-helix repeat protein